MGVLPEERRTEFERESWKRRQRDSKRDAWDDYFARRREASVQVGTNEHSLAVTLREDNPHRLALTLADDSEHWTIEIDVEHRRLRIVSANGTLDLTALLRANGTPGCLAGIL